jgi:antitoxin HicB
MNYPIIIDPCEEGGFVPEIPALSGCLLQGKTVEKPLQELIIVKDLWLETAQHYNQKLPNLETEMAKVKALSTVWSFLN